MIKSAIFKTKGMQRDLSASVFNPEYSYENKNIRIMSTNENTLLSLVNERGNKPLDINGVEGNYIKGTPIGLALVGDELVIFTCKDENQNKDRIYKLWFNDKTLNGKLLFEGDLELNYEHPIETISLYENTEVKKVYWTDGLNLPRVINIAATEDIINTWNNKSFDFVRNINLEETVTITKLTLSSGVFAPGVIQYAFTYFDYYGAQSNIFYTSPLQYISHRDRGGSPEETVSCAFLIELSNVDSTYLFVRIYSIHRSSINATPYVKIVADLHIENSSKKIIYLDSGTYGDTIDPTELLYIGGELIVAGTMSHKDGTLFLGDLKIKDRKIDKKIKELFKDQDITFEAYKPLESPDLGTYYSHKNQLLNNSLQIKTFKYLEYYRFGILAQDSTGKWGEPIFIKDLRNTVHVDATFYTSHDIKLPRAKCTISNSEIIQGLSKLGFTRIRPVIVYPNINEREVICLGILCPTVYNVGDRHDNTPFVQSSWFVRPNIPFNVLTTGFLTSITFRNVLFLGESDTVPEKWIIYGIDFLGQKFNLGEIWAYSVDRQNNIAIGYTNVPYGFRLWDLAPPGYAQYEADGQNHGVSFTYTGSPKYEHLEDTRALGTEEWERSMESKPAVISNYDELLIGNEEFVTRGNYPEFVHNRPIPDNQRRNAEIQSIVNPPKEPSIKREHTESELREWVAKYSNNFYVDLSIVTLHSPDIEFGDVDSNLDLSDAKLRIVGIVPLTSFASDIHITTKTPVNSYGVKEEDNATDELPIGFYKEFVGVKNEFNSYGEKYTVGESHWGYRNLISGVFWIDDFSYKDDYKPTRPTPRGFVVYPWHRNGSLNNSKMDSGYVSAQLDKKLLYNLRYSYKTSYMDPWGIWNAYKENSANLQGISGALIFDSNEVSLLRLSSPLNSKLADINYYGNIDKIIYPADLEGYPIVAVNNFSTEGIDINSPYKLFRGNYAAIPEDSLKTDKDIIVSPVRGTDPIRMKYKSTPHAVMALNYSSEGNPVILPSINDWVYSGENSTNPKISWKVNPGARDLSENYVYFYDTENSNVPISTKLDFLEPPYEGIKLEIETMGGYQYGWLWLGELYRDNVPNRFGGDPESAASSNLWLPCGEPVSIVKEGEPVSSVTVVWTEGDTYYLRYDHVKTLPFALEDQNQVTEVVSFMCETKVNIDGRYDRNRGQASNFAIASTNYNLINDVYSQSNNFFNYYQSSPFKQDLTRFPNTITWSKTKTAGEDIDTWTNVTLASTLDLDGDRGVVRALKRFNNNIFAFLDRGISQILYNESTLISSTAGVPIEIANSGKVNGKRVISEIGCTNKWSICETPSGIYFVDDITKGIFRFTGLLENLSDRLGFRSWIRNISDSVNIWNPKDFRGIITYYDRINGDVFFITKDECLAFSEPLGLFSSFYSYEKMPYFINIGDKGIAFNTKDGETIYRPWLHNEGDYNKFFGKYHPFYTTIIANPNTLTDKIFNNLEFRADTWNMEGKPLDTTFDTLSVWNEYQEGISHLTNIPRRHSDLKRKFRIWGANIPRDKANGRDRMRNPWLYIKLSMEEENTNKTILHDIVVHYFE